MELTKVKGLDIEAFLHQGIDSDGEKQRDEIEYFEKAKQEGRIIQVSFPCRLGNMLYADRNGVRVMLPADDASENGRVRRVYIGTPYSVIVTGVDREKNEVTVSVNEIRKTARNRVEDAIDEALEKGEKFVANARVVSIYNGKDFGSRLGIDIAGVGVVGYVPLSEWSHSFTRSFRNVVKVGDIIQVVVLKIGRVGETKAYECSRRAAIDDDIWEGIEDRYPKGSNIAVTCTERRDHNWFGTVQGLKDIEIYCEYPNPGETDRRGNKIEIAVGHVYNCYIYRVDGSKKLLKARPVYEIREQ